MIGPRVRNVADGVWPLPGSYLYDLDENYFRNPPTRAASEAGFDLLADVIDTEGLCGLVLVHTQLDRLDGRHP